MIFGSRAWLRHFGCAFVCAAFLSNACAGRTEGLGSGQQSPAGGGTAIVAQGGSPAFVGKGGSPAIIEKGGSPAIAEQGGATTIEEAGAADVEHGGTPSALGGRTSVGGGASGSAGSGPCAKVICGSIPTSCKHIVQGAQDCCPTCTDTGCAECPELSCEPGTHSATAPGDCCPSCVTDPPDACAQGKKLYDELRSMILDKYGSSGCKNSADCGLTNEDNACASVCNIALPAQAIHNWVSNLDNYAKGCVTCEAPARVECSAQIAACVNGKCVGVDTGP